MIKIHFIQVFFHIKSRRASVSSFHVSNVIWAATSKQINKWRRHTLQIGNTDMGHMAQSKITFIYNFSNVSRFRICSMEDCMILNAQITGGCPETFGLARYYYYLRVVCKLSYFVILLNLRISLVGSLITPTLIGPLPKSFWIGWKRLVRMANLLYISGLGVSRSLTLGV